jgi:ribosome-binding factor A
MMRFKNPLQKQLFSYCDAPGPDDGVDPRAVSRQGPRKVKNRKALQLCGQVERTLAWVLQGECGDDLLRDLLVASVVPAPDSTRLLVTVYPGPAAGGAEPDAFLERLHRAYGKLRGAVAAAIHRKKVPELIFRVADPGGRG